VWRTQQQRIQNANDRLKLAKHWWDWTPHPAQERLFCSGAPVKVAACGRRWGKTEALSIDIATLALTEPGSRQLVIAPTDLQARILGDAVRDRLEKVFADSLPELLDRTLVVRERPFLMLTIAPRGIGSAAPVTTIMCRTSGRDGRNLRGLWAHRIIVDEAALVPDSVLQNVLPPMLADKGGEFLLASSPNGRRSAFYQMYARGVAPQPPILGESEEEGAWCEAFQCPTEDNKAHLDMAYLTSQREDMGEAMYAQEYEAQFIDDFGAVFREEDIDAAIATLDGVRLEKNEIVTEPQPDHPYVMGIDWGRKRDYSVVAVLDASESPLRLVHLSRWRGTGWDAQAADAAAIVARFQPRRVMADGTSIGDPIAEMLTRQIAARMPPSCRCPTVERFLFGTESKQALIDRLNVGLSSRALRFPPHRTLVAELRGFEYSPGEGSRLKMGARSGSHDDCVVALALAYFAAPDPACSPRPNFSILLGSQTGTARREG